MTSITSPVSTRPLDAESLAQLARRRGECLTVLLPPSHPGASEGDRLTTLRSLFRSFVSSEQVALRMKIESALLEQAMTGGGSGLAIFAGQDFLEIYNAPVQSAQIFAGTYYFLLPFLLDVGTPKDFLILGVSEKLLRLLHYLQGECTPLELPPGMPANLEEFHGGEDRDRLTKNHSSAGSAKGKGQSVRFGLSAEHDESALHLVPFCARLDESLAPALGERTLLLMGHEEAIAAFRRAAKHCSLFAGAISQGMRDLPLREITQLAGECALAQRREEGMQAFRKIHERGDGNLAAGGNQAALELARAGRIHILCVPEFDSGQQDSLQNEESLNAAVAETLSHGGEVFTVRAEDAAPAHPLSALLRY